MRRNMSFGAAIVIERLRTDSTRARINAAHVIVRIFTLRPMEVLQIHVRYNNKKFHPQVYGNFVWEFEMRYNNMGYAPALNPRRYNQNKLRL